MNVSRTGLKSSIPEDLEDIVHLHRGRSIEAMVCLVPITEQDMGTVGLINKSLY